MTTKTDAARECAHPNFVAICTELYHRKTIGIIPGNVSKWCPDCGALWHYVTEEWQQPKHFPPSVPVSKLDEALNRYARITHPDKNEQVEAAQNFAEELEALIAEAEQESHCERISDMDLP